MSSYIEVKTLYKSEESRTVDELSKIYQDMALLKSAVHQLISNHISKDSICGKSVFLKPNWVCEELKESDYVCLRTNDNLMLCILEEVLSLSPIKVLMADAPIQGCNWEKMMKPDFQETVNELSATYHIPVFIKDLRRTVNDVENNMVEKDLHPMSDYLIFDLGGASFLEPITSSDNRFRVTCYDPDRMAEVHHHGMHKYCVAKDVFDYDVIITIPKLKTHRMAGMTNALKLLVGINGDKDYLPHHRIGSLAGGNGDNYLKKSFLRTMSNKIIDCANKHRGTKFGLNLSRFSSLLWRLSKPDKATMQNAGWWGNDTIWRTVMDLNTIALYGDKNGKIQKDKQRELISIMDGIVGGQGDGPLHPDPSPLGVLAISNSPYLMDVVAGHLYHLDEERIPLLRTANEFVDINDCKILLDSKEATLNEVRAYGIDIRMSPGWVDYRTKH